MQRFICANWKMNLNQNSIEGFCSELYAYFHQTQPRLDCVLIPAFPYLRLAREQTQKAYVQIGAQDCSTAAQGAHTGEVSASMIRDCGAKYVLIGHSERRHTYQEDSALLALKIKQAVDANLIPIFCFGESLEAYQSKRQWEVCTQQLQEVFASSVLEKHSITHLVLAYEPIWAIGTGLTPESSLVGDFFDQLQIFVHESFPNLENCKWIYGGSVSPNNWESFLAYPSIQGALVGGASLKPENFLTLLDQTHKAHPAFSEKFGS